MMTTKFLAAVSMVTLAMLLQSCESTDSQVADGSDAGQVDAFIDDIPMMADSFVLSTFELDADGEPVSVDSIVLVKEE